MNHAIKNRFYYSLLNDCPKQVGLSLIILVVNRHRVNGAVIARCSQPEVGWLGWRSSEDEELLKAIADACCVSSSQNSMRVCKSILNAIVLGYFYFNFKLI